MDTVRKNDNSAIMMRTPSIEIPFCRLRDMALISPFAASPNRQTAGRTASTYSMDPTRWKLGRLKKDSQCIQIANALPTISRSGTSPQTRESLELSRLSPIMK